MGVRESVLAFFAHREGEQALEQIDELDLFDSGYLDSLDIVDLVAFVQEKTGKKVDLSREGAFEKFRSLSGIVEIFR